MSRLLLALVLLLSACAPTTRQGWLTDVGTRSEGLCFWRGARWEDRGTLLVRGTGTRLAHARSRWSGDTWKGATAAGTVRRAGPVVLFEGEWSGAGVSLDAEVDVSTEAVVHAFAPARLGSAGLVLRGAPLRLVDALPGRVLALPTERAMANFAPEGPAVLELPCEGLSLYGHALPLDVALLPLGGFPAKAEPVSMPAKQRVPAAHDPGGAWVGDFVAGEQPLRAWAVERRDDATRVVLPVDGVLWVGWTASSALAAGTALSEPGATTSRPADEKGDWRACDDDVPLSVRLEGGVVPVGTLHRDAKFLVVRAREDGVVVKPLAPWLELEAGLELLAPSTVARCPAALLAW